MLVIFLPKNNHTPLTISANDITLNVDEEKDLSYTVSNPYAVVTFEIENKNIATSNSFKIKGLQEGETEITLHAKYNTLSALCKCKIYVVDVTSSPTLPDDNENNSDSSIPSDEENNSTSKPNEDTDNPSTTPDDETTENKYINFEIINQNGCQIDDKTITITKGKNCYFQLNSNEFSNWEDCTFETTNNIQISKITVGFNSWKIIAQESGIVNILYQGEIIGIIQIIAI